MVSSLLQNPHPAISSAPLVLHGLWLLSELLKNFSYKHFDRSSTQIIVAVLFLTVLCVYFSGLLSAGPNASQTFTVSSESVGNHQETAFLYLLTLFPTIILYLANDATHNKNTVIRIFYACFLVLSFLVCIYTSHLGGDLVFQHGAGVRARLNK